jgi:hypothetical protein
LNTTEALNLLAEYYAQRDLLQAQKQEQLDKIYTPEIRQAVADIEVEFAQKGEAVTANIATLEAEIKAAVLAEGATAKGDHLMAVFNKGRTSWDGKKLEGMMALIPQLAEARKVGEPTISFRKLG